MAGHKVVAPRVVDHKEVLPAARHRAIRDKVLGKEAPQAEVPERKPAEIHRATTYREAWVRCRVA